MKKGKVILQYVLMLVFIAVALSAIPAIKEGLAAQAEQKKLEESKVILYDGPLSLRDATEADLETTGENNRDMSLLHCTDTQITINGQDCYVYDTNVNHSRSWYSNYYPPQSRTPVAYFDFEGTVEIQVTVPNIDIENVKISPLSYEIVPIVDKDAHTVTFKVDTPDSYTLQFNDSPERAVHIFAYEIEEDVPSPDDENVIYLGPGEWDIDTISMKSGQTLYLAGGAVAHGTVMGSFVSDVTIKGHGILDGSGYEGWKGTSAQVPLKFDYCDNITIEDIIVLNSNAWVCQGYNSTNGVIDGVRIISSRPNGDGISLQSCQNYLVQNGFVRSWDDSLVVKNYDKSSADITFRNMQLWTDLAQSMEIGFETNKGNKEDSTITNIVFEDITVLNNYHKPIISIHNGDDALVQDIIFKDIFVEHEEVGSGDCDLPYLIDIAVLHNNGWSTTAERGNIRNVTLENITILEGTDKGSRIAGYDEEHTVEGVVIKNLNLFGKDITNAEDGRIGISKTTVSDVTFE
uniref:glycosyl hydrolase family 28 protein n=1 Tax=Acetatifactor sp. TaxID=1872090 RepID=UPI0040565EF0